MNTAWLHNGLILLRLNTMALLGMGNTIILRANTLVNIDRCLSVLYQSQSRCDMFLVCGTGLVTYDSLEVKGEASNCREVELPSCPILWLEPAITEPV